MNAGQTAVEIKTLNPYDVKRAKLIATLHRPKIRLEPSPDRNAAV